MALDKIYFCIISFMKQLLLIALLLAAVTTQAQTSVRLPLKAVTVYLNGAELQHEGSVNLPAGPVEIRLAELSPYLNDRSVQAEVTGAELEGVEFGRVQPQPGAAPVTLLDSVRAAQDGLQKLRKEEINVAAQKDFLEHNRQMESTTPGRWLEEAQRGAVFYGTALAALAQRDADVKTRLAAQTAVLTALTRRAGLTATGASTPEVRLRLLVPRAGAVRLAVRYAASIGPGWEPRYELRVRDNELRQLQVVSRAELGNYSGLNWTGVALTLNYTAPEIDLNQPDLAPWGVAFGRSGGGGEGLLDDFVVKGTAKTAAATTAAATADLGTRLRLLGPVTLAAGARRAFRLAETVLPMRLEYLAVPKRSRNVYLMAKVADWAQVGFLGTTAQVFFRGAYVGDTDLDPRAYADSLELSLGLDPQIVLTRSKREDLTSTRDKTRLVYELTAKNNHSYPVRLRLLDQVPIAQESEITVKTVNIGGAALDAPTGRLTWVFTLAPGDGRRFPLEFTVESPKGKPINLRRDRYIAAPKTR